MVDKSYECRECERVFTTEDRLDKHIKNHEEHRPHKCPRCNKGFKQPSHLSQHLRTHTDERPFPCEVCSKCFKQSCQLKQHMRLHTGEKPYQCPECSRSFKQASQLNQHVRLHTGEKPYKCVICTKTFTQASQLRSHKKTHEPKEIRKSSGKKPKTSSEQSLPLLVHKEDLLQPQAMHSSVQERSAFFNSMRIDAMFGMGPCSAQAPLCHARQVPVNTLTTDMILD